MKRLSIFVLMLLFVTRLNAQTANIDSLHIKDLMYKPVIDIIQFPVRNISADSKLKYQSFIEYRRTQNEVVLQDSLLMNNADTTHYNSFIQYVDTAFLSTAYGTPDNLPLTVATHFNAGNNGFNLSDVGTWFIPENVISGTIQVEVRAGGSTIQDAVMVSQGSAKFQFPEKGINGHLFNIHLDKEVTMYPNEDFYVIFTYPGEISRPQGCAVNDSVASVEGRYWVEVNSQFVDLQQIAGYSNGAWLMYAAEKTPRNIGWLSIIRNASGSINAKDSTYIQLKLNGLIASSGSWYADVVILSNDTLNPVIRKPVELRLNEAPYFLNAPTDISIIEGETAEIKITVKDLEGDKFTIAPVMGSKFVQFSVNDSILTLKISPEKGYAGDYTVIFSASDEYNMSRKLQITIHVLSENQPPAYIGDGKPIVFSFMDKSKQFNINQFFSDPDNDAFTFTIIPQKLNIVDISTDNQASFTLTPKSVGNTTLDFTLTDIRGAQSQYSIDVIVGQCENPDGIIIQKWNKTLLVNNYTNAYDSAGYQWYRNGMPIKNATRQDYCSEDDTGGLLDFTAEYFVRMIKLNGDTVYTCPYTPIQKANKMNVFPNPVAKGASISIESGATGSGTIQIIDITGCIQKTIQTDQNNLTVSMPTVPGLYLVKIVYGNNRNVFRIKVY